MRFPRAVLWLVPPALAGGGLAYLRTQPRKVEVVAPIETLVVESIAASGRLRGQVETSVGAQSGGRVAAVFVREGDNVRAGQPLARLDDSVLTAQAEQARSAVRTAQAALEQATDAVATARAALAQASRAPLASEVARLKADTSQSVAVARARESAARQRLAALQRRFAELKKGPRDEEIASARAQLLQAQATEDQARREQERQKALLEEGAVAQSAVDSATTSYWVARRARESAQARLEQLTRGTRPEQLDQARADVRGAEADVLAAQATLSGARASGEAQLQTLLSQPRREDVELARTRLNEAIRAREVARQRLFEAQQAAAVASSRSGESLVKAPFDGTIVRVVTEPGGVTGPSQPLVQLVRTTAPEIRLDLDEVNLGRISLGQKAIVTCDAYPKEQFSARIRQIGAQVDADRGTVEVRLAPENPPKWLRPGQTLSVNIVVDAGTRRLVVPLLSVNTIAGVSSVLVAEGGRIQKRLVKVGPPGPGGVPVLEGIRAGDLIVANPAGLQPGEAVAPVKIKPSPGPGK